MIDPYIEEIDGTWYCMLPGQCYKEIPYINWVEDLDWHVIYYKVHNSMVNGKITYDQIKIWPIEKILEVAADIRL